MGWFDYFFIFPFFIITDEKYKAYCNAITLAFVRPMSSDSSSVSLSNVCVFLFDIAKWIWRHLFALFAVSFAELAQHSWSCIQGLPFSLQVIASVFFTTSESFENQQSPSPLSAVSDSRGVVRGDSEQGTAALGKTHDAQCQKNREFGTCAWIPRDELQTEVQASCRAGLQKHTSCWCPLTLASLLPIANPPLWPQSKTSSKKKRIGCSVQSSSVPGGGFGFHSTLDQAHRSRDTAVCATSAYGRQTSACCDSAAAVITSSLTALFTKRRHKILVLDLDETLVYTSVTTAGMTSPPTFSEAIPTLRGAELFHVWERPWLQLFLRSMSRVYNIAVFTAAAPAYADPIIDRIDPSRCIKRRLYRGDCTPMTFQSCKRICHMSTSACDDPQPEPRMCGVAPRTTVPTDERSRDGVEGFTSSGLEIRLVKDLSVLGAPLSCVIMLDNSPSCFALHKSNGIVVPSYTPVRGPVHRASTDRKSRTLVDKNDEILLGLIPFLEALSYVPDVRCVLQSATCDRPF